MMTPLPLVQALNGCFQLPDVDGPVKRIGCVGAFRNIVVLRSIPSYTGVFLFGFINGGEIKIGSKCRWVMPKSTKWSRPVFTPRVRGFRPPQKPKIYPYV